MDATFRKIIEYATLAPSGHNTQPWQFLVHDDTIRICPDFSRRLPVVDPDDHALFISLGCALENLVNAVDHHGFGTDIEYFPDDDKDNCLRVILQRPESKADTKGNDLYDIVPVRQSTRNKYDGCKIPESDLQKLKKAAERENVKLLVMTDREEIEPIIELVMEANRRQFNNRDFVDELLSWIRFSKKDARNKRDGLAAASMGAPWVPNWLGQIIFKLSVGPEKEAGKAADMIRGSSGLLLFIAEENTKTAWVDLGRSFERTALTAAKLGIKHAHMNMPCEEVPVRKKLSRLLGLGQRQQPLLLLRIGYAEAMPKSFRRPVKDVTVES